MEETSQFYVRIGLIVDRNILRVVYRHSGDKRCASGLSLGGIRKVTVIVPRVSSEVIVKNWTSVRDAIRSTPGASPPHLGGRTGRDE